jgi:hypothetical protein
MSGCLRGSVDEVLEERKRLEQAFGDELEVAVARGIHNVEPDDVDVHRAHGQSSQGPRSQDWNNEIPGVCQMLRKRMHRT